ncbi:MAG: hypothetical protein O3B41_11675 [Bacteroidetes bacterium]|nr:hypothetical protein [Bacteroidota bacterium]
MYEPSISSSEVIVVEPIFIFTTPQKEHHPMSDEKQPRKKRKTCPLQIFRVDQTDTMATSVLTPIGIRYQELSKAMAGLKEHVRMLDFDAEPAKYVIASIRAEVQASVRQTRVAVLTELE